MTREEWLAKNGFNADGQTFSVFGEDTYAIKDWLKEQGCVFSPVLKWHIAEKFELPEGFQWVEFQFDKLYDWNDELENAFFFESAAAEVDSIFQRLLPPSKSEYMGEMKERLRNLTAVFKSRRAYNGNYGVTNIYTFYHGDNCLVWFSTVEIGISTGTVVDLTGTVVKHEEFRGVKTTKINRCIVKEVV